MQEYLRYIKYCLYVYCAFVGLDNKLYKMHGTYIKTCIFSVNDENISLEHFLFFTF